jgi:nicotinamidase-related amidase
MKSTGILCNKETVFVLVDLQEAFAPVVKDFGKLVKNAQILVDAAQILKIPLLVTEQYPKGLGKTVGSIKIPLGTPLFEKAAFSCFGCSEFAEKVSVLGFKRIVLFGIEAHVCVLQTALDAIARGLEVHIAADAVGSRAEENKMLGIDRARQSGAFIASTEMVLFQILREAGSEEFKRISRLVK